MKSLRYVLASAALVVIFVPGCGESATSPAPESPVAAAQRLVQLEERTQAALANQRDITAITADVRAFVAEHEAMPQGHRLLGLLLTQQDQPAEAYQHLSLAVADEATATPEMHAMLGSLSVQLDRPAEALEHYQRAIALQPMNMRFRLQLAQTMLTTGDRDLAAAELEEIIRLDASLHQAFAMLGRLEADAGNLQRATRLTGKAIQKAPPHDARLLTNYARQQADHWLKLGQPQQALAVLRVLPMDAQTSPAVSEDLARAWSALGEPAKAAKHYEQIAVMMPALIEPPQLAAQWYEQAGMSEEAQRMREMARRRSAP